MVNTRGTHKRRRLPAAVYLCYLLVAVLAFTGASVAGYKTENSGDDSARVARFNIEAAQADSQSTVFKLNSTTKSGSYSFTVTNGSGENVTETAVSYDVVVTVPDGKSLPNGVTVSLKNGDTTTVSRKDGETGSVYTFPNAGIFKAASPDTQNLTLTFTAGTGASSGSVSGISVEVVATQID